MKRYSQHGCYHEDNFYGMLSHLGKAVVCALALTICVSQSNAQSSGSATAMDGRVSPTLRTQVMLLVDSAVAAGLPSAPLIDKALEGVSKGASERRILTAVRNVVVALGEAQRALGTVSNDELTAAAAALRAGVPATALVGLQRSLAGRSLVVPLSVLSALVVQGVTPPAATTAVVAYAKHNNDGQMLAYGRDIVREIAEGMDPQIAAMADPGSLHGKPKP
jgi:hypothetical protein